MRLDLLTPDSLRWDALLSDIRHDFYHLPEYVRLAADQEGGQPFAFVAEENGSRLFLPLLLRPIRGDCFDATCPYGYAGPILRAEPGDSLHAFVDRAVRALIDQLAERKVVSAFFRLHPLFPVPEDSLTKFGTLVHHGETVAIDLTLSPEEIWRQTSATHRRRIHQARREGLVVEIDAEWRWFDAFYDSYLETMHRVGASGYYHFSQQYFHCLREALGDRLHLCIVRDGEGVGGGGLFTEVDGIVQYHLGGTKTPYLARHVPKAMFDFVRYWARDRGNRLFHLGGGVGGRRDSLFEFKAGFSKLHLPFFTWRLIIDGEAYAALVRDWEARSASTADGPDGFFPAYRKGSPS